MKITYDGYCFVEPDFDTIKTFSYRPACRYWDEKPELIPKTRFGNKEEIISVERICKTCVHFKEDSDVTD